MLNKAFAQQLPRAMSGGEEAHYRAMAAVLAEQEWLGINTDHLVGVAMKACHGTANPTRVREAIERMKTERGMS